MSFPNPHRPDELLSYKRVKIGGRWIKAPLHKVDGNEIEDDWNEQKPTGKSGAKYVFKGTKPPSKQTWTFRTGNDGVHTPEEMFDDLMEIYDLLAPKPGLGGGSPTAPAAAGSEWTIGATKGGGSAGGSSSSPSSGSTSTTGGAATSAGGSSSSSTDTDSTSTKKDADPGPKPPTLSVESAYLLRFGVAAISRAKWKGPTFLPESGAWEVEITVVPQQEPIPAGVGAAAPKTPDTFTLGAGGTGGAGGSDPAAKAKKDTDNAGAQ